MKAYLAVPATLALMYRAHTKKSLTPAGIVAAVITAISHAVHPWNLPFVLLIVFFLAGTRVTHIKQDVKAHLTMPSKGSSGGEGPRTHIQVFANSFVASFLSLLHAYQLWQRETAIRAGARDTGNLCFSWGGDLLVIGIIANYACVAADTFSSELGILSRETPRLITSLTLRKVPRGTNGGVTLFGLGAGLLGSTIMVTTAMLFLPFCNTNTEGTSGGGSAWTGSQKWNLMLGLTVWGALGSLLDSILGGLFQRSVRDARSGKIVEGEGGVRVLVAPAASSPDSAAQQNTRRAEIKAALLSGEGKDAVEHLTGGKSESAVDDETTQNADSDRYDPRKKHRRPSYGNDKPSRVVESGWDLLDNNDVNFLMAFSMSMGAIFIAASYWGVPLDSIPKP